MRALWIKRPVLLLLGAILLASCMSFMNGYNPFKTSDDEKDRAPLVPFADLEQNISSLYDNLIKSFEQQQDALKKILAEDSESHRRVIDSMINQPVQGEQYDLDDLVAYGEMKHMDTNLCLDIGHPPFNTPIADTCQPYGGQYTHYRGSGELYMGHMKSHRYKNRCLVDMGGANPLPGLYKCKQATEKGMSRFWDFTQGKEMKNIKTQRCLEIVYSQLVVQECTGQRWEMQNIIKPF